MFTKFVGAALAALLLSPPVSMAAPACLLEAGDAAALEAARLDLESSCPCDDYAADGKQSRRGDYLKCAKAAVATSLEAGDLRKPCRKLALYGAAKSTCGYPDVPARKACLRPTSKGFACKISTCLKEGDVACPQHDCLAAADTSGDGQVTASDSGQCLPLRDCESLESQTAILKDLYINECFGGCTEPLTFSECVLGCGSANAPLLQIQNLTSADCESDPARSCLQLHAAALGSCTGIGAPAQCALACLAEAVCLESCLATADCERYAAEAYALCLAGD